MTSQLGVLELERKAQMQELEMMRAVVAESKGEAQRAREELISEHAKEISLVEYSIIVRTSLVFFYYVQLSSLRIKTAADIADRDRKLIDLTEKLSSHEREFTLEKERLQGEIETKILLKYENIQREFEQKLLQEVNNTKSMQNDLLQKREEDVLKLEQDIAEKVCPVSCFARCQQISYNSTDAPDAITARIRVLPKADDHGEGIDREVPKSTEGVVGEGQV